jgi:mono/diheme cytochrome c family protein
MRLISFRKIGCWIWAFIALAAAAGMMQPVAAEDVRGNVDAGRKLAFKECRACHTMHQAERATRLYEAPGFDEIADKRQTTEISLRAFLQSSHPSMPNFTLSESERDDVIAYILSLRKQKL